MVEPLTVGCYLSDMKYGRFFTGLSLGIVASIAHPPVLHAEEPLHFMQGTVIDAESWFRAAQFSLQTTACADVIGSFTEAVSSPRSACEIFVTSPDPLTIPESVTTLTSATSIGIDGPSSVSIPRGFWTLRSLEELQIAHAGLTKIPDDIGQLTNLTVLDLSGNAITSLPETMRNLQKLRVLFLRENPLTETAVNNIRSWLPETEIVLSSDAHDQ